MDAGFKLLKKLCVLTEEAISMIEDIQMKLEKIDKINAQLIRIENDVFTIKGVAELVSGFNSVNSKVAEIKENMEKRAEKEKLEDLENGVGELRNRYRLTTLYSIMSQKKQKENAVKNLFKTLYLLTWS